MISQTNRTILFDLINPEVNNLSVLMAGTEENVSSLTDEKIKEINEALLVDSFEDFLKKFKPTIYSYFDANNIPQHSLVKPVGVPDMFVKTIELNKNNRVLKMFTSMMDRKGSSNTPNVTFDYEAITKMLAPEKALQEMQKIKLEIKYLEVQNEKLEKDSPAKADAVKKLLGKYESTKKYYNETGAQLALAAGMLKENLVAMQKATIPGTGYAPPALPVFEDSELKSLAPTEEFLKLSVGKSSGEATALIGTEDGEEGTAPTAIDYKQYTITTLEKYYDQSMNELYSSVGHEYDPEKGNFQRGLVLSAFTDSANIALLEMTPVEKVQKYNQYATLHALWEKSFVRESKVLIEKLLSIKAFFDQYKPKQPKMKPKLFVVNSRLEDIVDEDYLRQLQQYLETVNNKLECDNAIWFGIVPDLKFSGENNTNNDPEINPEIMREMGFTGDFDTGTQIEPNDMANLQLLLDKIKKYKIQVFFSFETGDDTTFSRLGTHGIQPYIDKTEDLLGQDYAKFAIASFPNFTVIPRDRSKVVYGKRATTTEEGGVGFSEDIENQFKFWIYGVYVGAAFVAAGLTAASQCPKFLTTKFEGTRWRVASDLPGVRFDVEAENYAEHVTTTFAKEIGGVTNDDRQRLNENNFGYVFSSDKTGKIVVFKARSMYEKDGSFVNVFKETARTYILRKLRILSSDKLKGIQDQYAPNGQVKQWELVRGCVNSILSISDEIRPLDRDEGRARIEVIFGGTTEYIDLDIVTDTD